MDRLAKQLRARVCPRKESLALAANPKKKKKCLDLCETLCRHEGGPSPSARTALAAQVSTFLLHVFFSSHISNTLYLRN